MFSRGSRYRNLPESVFLNAKGERARGKHVRLISLPEARVLHTVTSGDRLDLLAYSYYGDTKKWWQIGDANPRYPYPPDLLDQSPIVEELLTLTHPDFELRYAQLITALKNLGTVHNDEVTFFDQNIESNYAFVENVQPNFLEETVLVIFAPAARAQVLAAIQARGFHRLSSFGFAQGPQLAESFTIDDPAAKESWNQLIATLRETPGVVRVHSTLTEATIGLTYNSVMVARESLVGLVKTHGFTLDALQWSRVGRKILIPPNQVV